MSFSLRPYLGKWFEVGRFNAPFEQDCASAIAEYDLNDDGSVHVHNICLGPNGRATRDIHGRATARPGEAGVFDLSFGPSFPTSQYRVLRTDYTHYSIVGNPATGYVSVLWRTPTITPAEKSLVQALLGMLGFKQISWVV